MVAGNCHYVRQPLEQSSVKREHFSSLGIIAKTNPVMICITMVHFESISWELKSSDFAADFCNETVITLDSQWSNRQQKGSFLALRDLIPSPLVSIFVCLPRCRGSPGTHLVMTLCRNIPTFYTHINWRCITTKGKTEKKSYLPWFPT